MLKKLYLFIAVLFLSFHSQAQDEFIVVYSPVGNQIVFGGHGTNYTIEWEQVGNPFNKGTLIGNGITTFSVPTSNIYQIKASAGAGSFTGFTAQNTSYLYSVEQWGNTSWENLSHAFQNCYYMDVIATDVPDLSKINSLEYMFAGCNNLFNINGSISHWDVSKVTNMEGLFKDAHYFNQPLNNWKVDSVTNMKDLFNNARQFDQSLSRWNVSKVTNMEGLFRNAYNFNDQLNNWNVSSVTNMKNLFHYAIRYDQPLDKWDVRNVLDMEAMFAYTQKFNQPIGMWEVDNVLNMKAMFSYSEKFDQPLNNWNVSNVKNMGSMFQSTQSFNQPLNSWTVSSVTNMNSLFFNAYKFNQPLDNWDVSNVVDMYGMFENTREFNQPLNNWNVSNVVYMNGMFGYARKFNQKLGNWKLANGVYLNQMFNYSAISCGNYSATLAGWANNPTTPNNLNLDAYNINFGTSGQIARDYLINTKMWTITGDNFSSECRNYPLSVQLISFSGKENKGSHLLSWSTNAEIHQQGYVVERSTDGRNFLQIGFIASSSKESVNHYQFTDNNPINGHNYYRLKMISLNGEISYSNIIHLHHQAANSLTVHPNPVKGIMNLQITDIQKVQSLRLFNTVGALVYHQKGKINNSINVQKLPAGLYHLQVNYVDNTQQIIRVIID